MKRRGLFWMAWATLAAVSGGCGGAIKSTHQNPAGQKAVALDATREELIDRYNAIAAGVQSFNATVQLRASTGSQYSGVIDEYHEVKAFLLASRPANIRVIGQAPVIGKTVFDMASDAETFRVSIPSKNKFLVGPIAVERASKKPIENLRPQHLLDAILWSEIRKQEPVLFEEFNDETGRYYVLTVLRGGYQTEILRKIWFNRADLQVSRIEEFGPKGVLVSDIRYSNWEPVAGGQAAATATQNAAPSSGIPSFPRDIHIDRVHDDYQLELQVTKLALNEDMPADRFKLDQPQGSELVRVGDDTGDKQK